MKEIPHIEKLLGLKGVGLKTVSVAVAEIGDIERFDNAKQLQELVRLAIVLNDSGKHNGKSRISYRDWKRPGYALYEMILSVVGKNKDFQKLYRYYIGRTKSPLKKMQEDIHRPEAYKQVA